MVIRGREVRREREGGGREGVAHAELTEVVGRWCKM